MPIENLMSDLELRTEISLYYDLYLPKDNPPRSPLMITVHGYGAHKRYMMREARLIAPDNFVIASLQGPHQHFRKTDDGYRTGFGWLTDHRPEESIALHHQFVLDVIDRLAADDLIDRKQVWLYGFSQACALNFRFAFMHPNVLRGVIGVCGGIPSDLDTNPLYNPFAADTLYIYDDDDEFYPLEKFKEFDEKLRSRLPNYRSKQFAAKHVITDAMREEIGTFIRANLT